MPTKEISCLMGMEDESKCVGTPFQINLKWEIINASNTLIASGLQKGRANSGGWSKRSIDRGFTGYVPTGGRPHQPYTSFNASKGQQYRMRLTVIESGALLSPAEPHITIGTCYNPLIADLR